MKFLVFLLLIVSSNSYAAYFKVVGVKPILNIRTQTHPKESVGAITYRILAEAQKRGILKFEGNDSGILSINGLGNKTVVISDTKLMAFGWCFSVNGNAPDLMPNNVFLNSPKDKILWFYAYSLYDSGTWVNQCVPVEIKKGK